MSQPVRDELDQQQRERTADIQSRLDEEEEEEEEEAAAAAAAANASSEG